MSISINNYISNYSAINNVAGNNMKTNSISNNNNQSNTIVDTINKTFSENGIDVNLNILKEINPAENAKSESINKFMKDLFSNIGENENNNNNVLGGEENGDQNSKDILTNDLMNFGISQYNNASTKIQNLISQLNQDSTSNIVANQLKQDFDKINNNPDVTIQTFLSSLNKNLNSENITSKGNNLDIFAS